MPEIIIKFDNKIIERIVAEKKRLSIGRTPDNDIVLDNRGVSRKHAQIEFNESAAVIIDNQSLNGTFVNNRKVGEEILRDDDEIMIGKYTLVYKTEATHETSAASMDGTMVLNTKKQKEMLKQDQNDRELVDRMGASVLVGEEHTDFSEYRIDRNVTTIGKAKFVHVHAKGFLLSGIQAKIVKDNEGYSIVNLGRKGKTKLNGEQIDQYHLKNGDLIQVGKSTYRFVEGK